MPESSAQPNWPTAKAQTLGIGRLFTVFVMRGCVCVHDRTCVIDVPHTNLPVDTLSTTVPPDLQLRLFLDTADLAILFFAAFLKIVRSNNRNHAIRKSETLNRAVRTS